MSRRETYTFVCPACAASVTVDDAKQEALLTHGCVVCGTTVSPRAFTR